MGVLSACKKEVVHPVNVEVQMNKLPKRMLKQQNLYGKDVFSVFTFKYNNDSLISEVVQHDSVTRKIITKTTYSYNDGNLIDKVILYGDHPENFSHNSFEYVDHKLISITQDVLFEETNIFYDNLGHIKYIKDAETAFKDDSLVFINSYAATSDFSNVGTCKVTIYHRHLDRNLRDSVHYNIQKESANFDYWYSSNYEHHEKYYFSDKKISLQDELADIILPVLKDSKAERIILRRYLNNYYCVKSEVFGTTENTYTFDNHDRLIKVINGSNLTNPVISYISY